MRILGIDPGLMKTGWGIIDTQGHALHYVASGLIKTNNKHIIPDRLRLIDEHLSIIIKRFEPHTAAVEETFVNKSPKDSLKLGFARGVAMVVPARHDLFVGEYPANLVKKTVVGAGKAGKDQVGMMIKTLLPTCGEISEDEADALAVAICHAHHYVDRERINQSANDGAIAGTKLGQIGNKYDW